MAKIHRKGSGKAIFYVFFEKNVAKSLQVIGFMPIFAPKNVTPRKRYVYLDVRENDKNVRE
jgi:hypothetical protein